MADKKVIVEIQYDTAEAVKSIERLTSVVEGEKVAQAQLKAELEKGEISQKEYAIAVEQSKQAQQKANAERKNTLNLLGAEKGSVNEIKASIKQLEAEQNKINRTTADGSKQYKESAAKLAEMKKALKDAQSETGKTQGVFGRFGQSLKDIPGPIGGIVNGIGAMSKAGFQFALNPIGAIITALAVAVALVVKAFKQFEPVLDWIEQKLAAVSAVFTVFKEVIVSLFTGQKKLNEAFDGMGASMKNAADEAIRLKKAEQELEDMAQRLIASQATYKRQIDQLLLQSKNRTLSEKERMALIDEALTLEEKAYKERQEMADGEYEQAIGKIINGRNLTEEQKKNLREQGVAYAQYLQGIKAITKEEVDNFANAIANRENILSESISLQEKAMNRRDALADKQAEKDKIAVEEAAKQAEAAAAIAEIEAETKAQQFTVDDQMAQDEFAWTEAQMAKEKEATDTTLELSAAETEQLNKDLEEGYNNFVKWKEQELAKHEEISKAKQDITNELEKQGIKIATDQFNAFSDNQLNSFKDSQNAQLDALKVRLENGQISEANYEKKVKAIKLKVRQEEAKAEKIKALFDIGINTIVAVVKALPNIPLSLLVGALGIASGISVAAKPLPKFAQGGVIGGLSHSQGGTKFIGSDGSRFEAERGEAMFVLKKDATAEIAALSAINESFGGRSLIGGGASHLANGGEVAPVNISGQVNEALRNTPIIVRVADISTGLTDVANVKKVGVI